MGAKRPSSQVPHIWPLALEKKQLREEVLPALVSGLSVLLRTLGKILAEDCTYKYQKILMRWLVSMPLRITTRLQTY
jgi:hypothetical protein